MTSYHIAELGPAELRAIEELENRLGLTLIAWAPAAEEHVESRRAAPPEAALFDDPDETLL